MRSPNKRVLMPNPSAATARSPEMSVCVICHCPLDGPSVLSDGSAHGLHPRCLADSLPHDAAAALLAAAALFLIPFIRVWSA
jgi:hypothetical protein